MKEKLVFEDNRGAIFSICEKADVIRITSVKGAKRANHYHRNHGHVCIVTKGSIMYLERPVGSQNPPTQRYFKVGEQFSTEPMMEHLMLFPDHEVNEFYCFSFGPRDAESYEQDTVRLETCLKEIADLMEMP